jgi:hypothetical protein
MLLKEVMVKSLKRGIKRRVCRSNRLFATATSFPSLESLRADL